MANYPGATQGGFETTFLGGLDTRSTMLNIAPGKAARIENLDLANDGSLTSRPGYVVLATLGQPMRYFGKYTRIDAGHLGEDRWVAVAGNKIWDAADPAGPWNDITGGVSFWDTTRPVIGASFRGRMILANGVDKPLCLTPGSNAVTLEDASKLLDPTSLTLYHAGADGALNNYYLGISAKTPRGETKLVVAHWVDSAPAPTAAIPIQMTWDPIAGAYAYRIYFLTGGVWKLIEEVTPDILTYDYYGQTPQNVYAQPVNQAYNTPNNWNTDGQPELFAVVAEGRDERLFAVRKDTVWSSALANPLDWFSTEDAFAFTVIGGKDRNITAIGSTFDYTLLGSSDTIWVYTGAGPTTITCQKILPVGIRSHNSILNFGTDVYFWSQYGPTSMTRILSGADLSASTDMQASVNPTVYESNSQAWQWISGHVDTPNNRLIWWYPKGAEDTSNNAALVYQANSRGFTTYQSLAVVMSASDQHFNQYIALSNGEIAQFGVGNSDNGSRIHYVYQSRWYDMNTWGMRKRVIFFDVVMDKTVGTYATDFSWSTDYGKYISNSIQVTPTTTDGEPIESTGPDIQIHRLFANGYGNSFAISFSGSTQNYGGAKFLALKPDTRVKGTRR